MASKGNDVAMVKRLGVLGGTFNPIHKGHLALAERAMDSLGLDLVLFVPSVHAAHKGEPAVSAEDRSAMVRLAVGDNPRCAVSDIELRLEGMSFTADMLRALSLEAGSNAELFFIVGSDVLATLQHWKEPKAIFRLARVAVCLRPGYEWNNVSLETAVPAAAGRVIALPGSGMDISSTLVRDRLAQGLSVDALLAEAVAAYVRKRGLYGQKGSVTGPLQWRWR